MLDLKEQNTNPKLLSPLTLAFVGDAVYELLVRERLAADGSRPANVLHHQAVQRVCATAQANVYRHLEGFLTPEEESVLRRGRNAHSTRVPKHSNPSDYRKATGVEALFGYLYLKGELGRIEEIYKYIAEDEMSSEQGEGNLE